MNTRAVNDIFGNVEEKGGSLSVSTSPSGISHIREIDALGTTPETLDWSTVENGICAVKIYVLNEAATTTTLNAAVVCIDPPSNIVRDTWLTAGDSAAADSNRIPVIAQGEPLELEFRDTNGNLFGISYIGIKRDLGSDALRIIAVGTEASV